ncbi:MAG: hypothetical protein GY758_18465 [Fuerstiella sp.]|nr:hypothetical protein [Fuerstiella sp.]MCP4507609.1 hypothetical protein [Fuerstiella sp.]
MYAPNSIQVLSDLKALGAQVNSGLAGRHVFSRQRLQGKPATLCVRGDVADIELLSDACQHREEHHRTHSGCHNLTDESGGPQA